MACRQYRYPDPGSAILSSRDTTSTSSPTQVTIQQFATPVRYTTTTTTTTSTLVQQISIEVLPVVYHIYYLPVL